MLSGLRLRLTALYLAVGLAFLALVCAGSYRLLEGYYEASTDLALQHRLVQVLTARGATVPPDLAAADRAWYAGRGRPMPTSAPPAPPAPAEGGEGGDGDSDDRSPQGDDREQNHAAEEPYEAFDAELAAIYVVGLDGAGQPAAGAALPAPQLLGGAEAVAGATAHGLDWRTVSTPNGTPVRLLTYVVAGGGAPEVLQLGRPLADQDRVMRRLMTVLLGLGALCAVLLGAGGWWLAGRSLKPAEEAWQRQQTFVANASHELRTPLTLIRASAEVLARDLPPAGEERLLVDDILAESDHMSRLVSDLLLLSRLDSGQLAVARQPVALTVLFADLARQFGRRAAESGVAFGADGAGLSALADPVRLRQVLLVVLDNAIRHTPAGGAIRLAAERDGGRIVITVTDTGAGIAPEHLPRVFERFYRTETNAGEPGAGLGLSVAQALVTAQQGHIHLDSRVGQGTRVRIDLPAADSV